MTVIVVGTLRRRCDQPGGKDGGRRRFPQGLKPLRETSVVIQRTPRALLQLMLADNMTDVLLIEQVSLMGIGVILGGC